MTRGSSQLQAVYLWGRVPIGYRLLRGKEGVSLGTTKASTFVAPPSPIWPRQMRVLNPIKTGYRLRVWPGMSGQVQSYGQPTDVASLLSGPAPKRFLLGRAAYRDIPLQVGDSGEVIVEQTTRLRLRIEYVDPPEHIPRPRIADSDPLFLRTFFWSSVSALSALILILLIGPRIKQDPFVLTPERYATVVAPITEAPDVKAAMEQAKQAAAARARERDRKRREREAAEARRAKEKEGSLGKPDAEKNETVLPKGREDILREKVSKTGLLAAVGSAKASGSGLGKLLTRNDSGEMEQALNGLVGAKLAVGRGSGGLGTVGTGLGGGGTSFGHIQGSGDLDVGAGRGRGRKGPSLGTGKEKEVSVGMETGTPDAEGGLSKEQINRVVRAHAAAVKYCYEKELQRAPHLNGRIDLYWVIKQNGTVDRVKTAKSTMDNRAVEGCIERQVKNWQFPKSDADTIVQSYPFLFKGGS